MARPGSNLTETDSAPANGNPTNTGQLFTAGLTERGPIGPNSVTSFQAWTTLYGGRVSFSRDADSVEQYFKQGGRTLFYSRVVGEDAVNASARLNDASARHVLTASAQAPGDWYNALNVEVVAGDSGGTFKLIVSHDTLGVLERSPDLADNAAAQEWGADAEWVSIIAVGVADPAVVAAVSLAGGDDDRASVDDAAKRSALDLLGPELGPGQVAFFGSGTTQAHTDLAQHGAANNRRPLYDGPLGADDAALETLTDAIRSLPDNLPTVGALFYPWAVVAGVVANTTRQIPYSAIQAGLIARSDSETGNPNLAVANRRGRPVGILALTAQYTDAQRQALNEAGVNIVRVVNGQVRTYGYRTTADRAVHPLHWQFSNVRLDMAVRAEGLAIADDEVFDQITGDGMTQATYGTLLTVMLNEYVRLGAVYTRDGDSGFVVDTGNTVNTPESIADGRLRAIVKYRRAPFAELVELELVRVSVNEAL